MHRPGVKSTRRNLNAKESLSKLIKTCCKLCRKSLLWITVQSSSLVSTKPIHWATCIRVFVHQTFFAGQSTPTLAVRVHQSGSFLHPQNYMWQIFQLPSRSVSNFLQWPVVTAFHNLAVDSLRVSESGEYIYPPYTRLGWDQSAVALSDISANDVASFEHIAGFGRPLSVLLSLCSYSVSLTNHD